MPTFTRAQAEALLPKVRPLLEDLQRRKASYDRRPTDPVAKEINALLLEIAHLGVDVKGPDQGLIDFPAMRRGREVLLCWKLGEGDRISYWHDVETGFAGRKLIEDWRRTFVRQRSHILTTHSHVWGTDTHDVFCLNLVVGDSRSCLGRRILRRRGLGEPPAARCELADQPGEPRRNPRGAHAVQADCRRSTD